MERDSPIRSQTFLSYQKPDFDCQWLIQSDESGQVKRIQIFHIIHNIKTTFA